MRFEKFYSIRGLGGILCFEKFFQEGAGGDFFGHGQFGTVPLWYRAIMVPCHAIKVPCHYGTVPLRYRAIKGYRAIRVLKGT